ncbi:amino acid adenylation domain-containing protein [Ilyomonas limi]|uniref:Amino acid adenylation domain-containing protein n=1 Tax=Ilyomonas limi TaxID=2575867 RepID=A0A4U3KZM6_9BACT|nr:amino acid adenylation domain-containing protein [Ilyomonas limi]TKK67990.1 amino acid adenylation domain-containing protein [Ilyomonas limi]
MKDMFDNPLTTDLPEALSELTAKEKHLLLKEFNNTTVDYPLDKTVIDLFENQAALTPQAVAVTFEEQQLTYKAINEYANQLAHYLRSKGVTAEALVPICIERSPQMIIGILGILKAGGTYVPVDPDYPAERIQFMLEDTKAAIAVSSSTTKSRLQYSGSMDIIELDEELSVIRQQPATNITIRSKAHQLVYIIYTSGSTGKPKGVMIEHGGLVNLSLSQAEGFGLKPGTKMLQFASFGFDASCSEIFTTLLSGGCLVLPQKKDLLAAEEFEKLVCKHKVEVVTLPPSYQLLVKDNLGTIRTIISAGEALNATTGRYLQTKGIRLINGYGPTENTVCVSMSDDPIKDNQVVVIGKPISNVKVYILDKAGDLCPVGTAGEICVGGVQVARGYLNRPELTATKFVEDPFAGEQGARMYKTGDLGRWRTDGNIEFLGRFDDQVKIRGYRIELGEIENVLHQCELVSQAVVLAKEDKDGNKRLVAYIVPNGTFDRKAIIAYVKGKLPDYMVPSILVQVEVFPLTSNGKIDKKALPEPDMSEVLNKYAAPRTAIEQKLVNIWQKLFHIKQLGIHDNFFDLGGTSIQAIQVVSQARRAGYNLQPNDFFIHQTIEALAGVINERLAAGTAKRQHNATGSSGTAQSIITINSRGTKVPFFFMSPGFSVYDKVVCALDKDQPFYFFIPYPYKSVESIAAYYVQEMKKIQPEGPYCLGGYCGFGEVALEMAQQLTAKGDKVTFLALFEFYFPTAFKPVDYKERLKYYLDGLKNYPVKEKASLFYGFIYRKIRKLKRRTSKAIDRKLKNLPETTGYLIGKNLYTAKPYNGKVLLFRSNIRTSEVSDDPYMGWSNHFTGEVELYTIEGDHKTMFHAPGAVQIAEKLKAPAV